MTVQIFLEPGTEKWSRWAKKKLADLSSMREQFGLPMMSKFYVPEAGTLIWIKSSRWGEWIRITGGGHLGFSSDDSAFGLVVTYPGSDAPATIRRRTEDFIRDWSKKDGSVGTSFTGTDTRVYRKAVLMNTVPTLGSFTNKLDFFSGNPIISDDGAVVAIPNWNGAVGPAPYTGAKFAVYVPAIFDALGVELEPHRYDVIDTAGPDPVALSSGTASSFSLNQRWFYVDVTRLSGGTMRLVHPKATYEVYANLYDAREVYVSISAAVVVSVTVIGTSNSRAFQVTNRIVRKLFKYKLAEVTRSDGATIYSAGTWMVVNTQSSPDVVTTTIDQRFINGAANQVVTTTDIDGVQTHFLLTPSSPPFPATRRPAVDLVEPWFRLDGTMEPARHVTVGAPNPDFDPAFVIENFDADPPNGDWTDLFTFVNTVRHDFNALVAPNQKITLSGEEFAADIGLAEIPGERIATLRHLGLGRRALLETALGAPQTTWWVLPTGAPINFDRQAFISRDGDRGYNKVDFAGATEFWVDGTLVITEAPDDSVLNTRSYDDNAEFERDTGFADTFRSRLTTLELVDGAWELVPGHFLPFRVGGVEGDTETKSARTQPSVQPTTSLPPP